MASEIGSVGYGVSLNATDNGLLKTLQQVTQAMESLDRSVNSLSSKMDGSFKNMEQSASRASKATSSGMKSIAKAIVPTISTLDRLQDKYIEVRKSSQRIGDAAGSMKNVKQAMRSYSQMVEQGFQSTQHMQAATANLNREFTKAQQENQKYERAMLSVQKSIGSAERQVATMTSRLQAMGDSEKPVNELTQALQRYKNEMTDAAGDSQKTVAAQERFKNSVNQVENSTKKGSEGIQNYNQEFRNFADAAILTYGPLNGIAARITTFTRLARNNSAAIAAFTASVVGMAVSLSRSVRAGMEFERQMLGMEGMLKATGREAEITTQQLNAMAEGIAEATLSATNQTRQAATVLLQYSSIATDSFQDVLEAAQGAASAMGGSIVEATRQFARALEDPVNNLGALTRTGITFSRSQREMIESLSRTGQSAAAQAIVMERLSVFQELANTEAQGLAGALDTLGERFTKMYESVSANAEINDVLAEGINAVSDMVKLLTEDMSVIQPIMDVMRGIIAGLSGAMSILSDNFSLIAKIMSGVFIAIFVKTISTLTLFTGRILASTLGVRGFTTSIGAAAAALVSKKAATDAATLGVTRLTLATRALSVSMGAVLGAWPLIIAAAITAYGAFNNSSRVVGDYEKALIDLGLATEDVASGQESLANSLGKSSTAALKSARDSITTMEAEYENARLSIVKSTSGIRQAIMNAIPDGQQGGLATLARDTDETSEALRQVQRDMSTLALRMQQGGDVSIEAIRNITQRARELGVEFGEAEEDTEAFFEAMDTLSGKIREAEDSMKSLKDNLEDTGVAIDVETLFRGMTEDFQQYFVDIEEYADTARLRVVSSLMQLGDNAERAVKPKFDAIRNSYRQMFDAGAFGEGAAAVEAYAAALAIVDRQAEEAADSVRNVGDEFDRLKAQSFSDEIQKIGREMQILSATSDEARDKLKASFEQQDTINSLLESLDQLEQAQIDITVAAAAFNHVAGVDADTIKSYDDLRAAIESTVGTLIQMRSSNRQVSSSNKRVSQTNKESEKSLDSLIGKYEEFTDIMAQQERLASSGVQGVLDLQAVQAEEKAVKSIRKEIGKLSSNELAKFVKQSGLVVKAGESVADAMVRMTRDTANFQDELKKQEEANKSITDSFEDIINAYEEAEIGLAALMNGTEAYNRALEDLKISRQVDEITKAFDNLNPVDQAAKLAVLSEAFGIVGLTVENLPEKLTGALKGIEDISREIESQMKIAEAAEREAARFEEAWVNGLDNIQGTFKDAFLNIEEGFSSFADNLKNSFKNMLLDLAYEAYVRPIAVGFTSGGMGDVQQALGSPGGQGGFNLQQLGSLGNSVNGLFGGGSSGLYANAMTGGASAGGLYSSAATGAAQGGLYGNALTGGVASGQGGMFASMGGVQGLAPVAGAGLAGFQVGQMLASDAKYGKAAGALGAIGGAAFGPLGSAIGGAIAPAISKGLFGGTWQSTGKGGIELGIGEDGFQGRQFKEERKSGGLFRGSSYKNVFSDIDSGIEAQLSEAYESQIRAVESLFIEKGQEGALRTLNAFQSGFERITTSGMNDEQITQAVNDWLSGTVGDAISGAFTMLEGDFGAFLQILEGSTDEIIAQAHSASVAYDLLNGNSERLGIQFNVTGGYAYEAAQSVAEFAGGVENLSNAQAVYYQNFFSEEERLQNAMEDLEEVFNSLNLTLPESREGFRRLVEAQDLSTESGREAYATLLNLSSGFSELVPATKEAEKVTRDFSAAVSKRASLDRQLLQLSGDTQALRQLELESLREIEGWKEKGLVSTQKQIWAIQDNIEAREKEERAAAQARREAESYWNVVRSSLRSISGWVDNFMATEQSPTLNLDSAAEDFQKQFEKAASGDRDALSNITQYADRFLNAGELMYASGKGYQDIQDEVLGKLNSLPDPESDVNYLARMFDKSITDNLPKTISDTIKSLEYEIDSLIRFAADATNLPRDLRDIITKQAHDIMTTVDVILGSDVSEEAMQLALSTVNNLTATVRAIVSSGADEDAMRLGLESTNRINSLINAIMSSGADEDAIMLGLETANSLTTTVRGIFSRDLNSNVRKLALGSINSITTAVDAVYSKNLNSQIRKLALGNTNSLTTTVDAILDSNISEDARDMALQNTNDIATNITAVLSKNIPDRIRSLALGYTRSLDRVIVASISNRTDADARALGLNRTNNMNVILNGLISKNIPEDVLKLGLEDGNRFLTTLEASLQDGKLTPRELTLIDADAETLVRNLQVSGALNLTKDQWAVINAASGNKRLDLLADVAFKDADIKNLADIEGNTKPLGQANRDGVKVSLGRNHNPSGLIDMAYNWGTKWANMGAPAFGGAGGGHLDYQPPSSTGSSGGGSTGGATGSADDRLADLRQLNINQRAELYLKRYRDISNYYNRNSEAIKRAGRGDTAIDYAKWHHENIGKNEGRLFAKGGAFTNSIVNVPTRFDIGTMGEAGPEAIMPLSRGPGGVLGVQSHGGGNGISNLIAAQIVSSNNSVSDEIYQLRQDLNSRLDKNNEQNEESNAIDREGYTLSVSQLKELISVLSEMEDMNMLAKRRD